MDATGEHTERLGEAEDAITLGNGVILNGVILNGVILNGVILNSLKLNALQPAALDPTAEDAIEDAGTLGEEARHALRYVVGCALPANTSFDFSWTDAAGVLRQESYPGLLGLAPAWAYAPASQADLGWVSACIISRANRYGAPVELSSRGSYGVLAAFSHAERNTYTHLEGAFWGNLFASTPVAYACFNPGEVTYAQQQLRDCATGPAPDSQGEDEGGCGMIQVVGSCAERCQQYYNQWGYYSDCSADGGAVASRVVTVYLE